MNPHPWTLYGQKLKSRILNPINAGFFTKEEAEKKSLRLSIGEEGSFHEENIIRLYLLVDESDGVITDARFQAFGDTALIGAADALCELLLRKNILQARRIDTSLIEKKLQGKEEEEVFSKETYPHLNLTLSALENALVHVSDIQIEDPYSVSPVESKNKANKNYPDFDILSQDDKLKVIKEVIKEEIEPYIALDEGSIEVKELKGNEVIIVYGGACTSCFSATGATLSAIEKILKETLSQNLMVTPDTSVLNF